MYEHCMEYLGTYTHLNLKKIKKKKTKAPLF